MADPKEEKVVLNHDERVAPTHDGELSDKDVSQVAGGFEVVPAANQT
jgi:predicted transcriptional regulator